MSEKQRNYKVVVRDHILVTGKGGLIKTRDRTEEFEGDAVEMHKRINGRFDRYHPVSVAKEPNKAKREENQAQRDAFHTTVAGQLASAEIGKTIKRTVEVDGRKRFSYDLSEIAPFGHSAAPRCKTKAVVHDGISTPKQREEALKRLAETRAKLGMNSDGSPKDDTQPFSVVDDKPKADKPKGKASAPATAPRQHVQSGGKTGLQYSGKQPANKSGVIKLNKRQQNECDKFDIDVNNLPSDKPKGMNNKVWKAVVNAAKAA